MDPVNPQDEPRQQPDDASADGASPEDGRALDAGDVDTGVDAGDVKSGGEHPDVEQTLPLQGQWAPPSVGAPRVQQPWGTAPLPQQPAQQPAFQQSQQGPPSYGGSFGGPPPYGQSFGGQPMGGQSMGGQSMGGQSMGGQRPYPMPPQPPGNQYSMAPRPMGPPAQKGRVPGWLWPAVAALALVVGLAGGALGGALVQDSDGDGTGLVSGGLDSVDTRTDPPLEAENGSVAAVAQELLPSTVQILAEYGGEDAGATGSGFVLDQQGHIVTNNHVVADAAQDDGKIELIDHNGKRYDATVVGRSPVYDLAVLLTEEPDGLVPAALGASETLLVGESVVAIGSPLGLSSTVTSGIVSALNRPVTTGDSENESSYINAVQTDAAINPGNSGGPLVNLRGQVVGVNSAIATTGGGFGGESGNIGVGFAIPIEQVRITADQILKTGEARYPVIGAEVRIGGSEGTGAEIKKVNEGTPADKGGLREGDLVTEVDGDRVTDGISLIVAIRTHQPGETVAFTIERGGDEETVDIKLGSEIG
ncbi:S1C family serine protease [Nocardioides pacificus]